MDNHPLLERLAWIAGILSFIYLVWPSNKAEPEEPSPSIQSGTTPVLAQQPQHIVVGSCTFDPATEDGLNKNGLYKEIINLCNTGKASTIGQSFRIPSLSDDERYQYFNPVEFNNQHGLSDGKATAISVYNEVSSKILTCFSNSYDAGASPLERIDIELSCLEKNGIKAQDRAYYLLVENAKKEGRTTNV